MSYIDTANVSQPTFTLYTANNTGTPLSLPDGRSCPPEGTLVPGTRYNITGHLVAGVLQVGVSSVGGAWGVGDCAWVSDEQSRAVWLKGACHPSTQRTLLEAVVCPLGGAVESSERLAR